jgi:hypothetical protein
LRTCSFETSGSLQAADPEDHSQLDCKTMNMEILKKQQRIHILFGHTMDKGSQIHVIIIKT